MTQQPPQQPEPNVFAKLGGDRPSPWVTLCSDTIPLTLKIDTLAATLATIDGGLEIVDDSGRNLRILPRTNAPRERLQVVDAVKQLARRQQGWRVKWATD